MSKEGRRASAQRRGGGRSQIQFDTAFAESRYAVDNQSLSPDETFAQQWALTLLDLTVNRLSDEFAAAGKAGDFEVLKHCLMAKRGAIEYASVVGRLGANQGTARVAVHRLRKRFCGVFRDEIAQTVAQPDEVEEEIRHLLAALSG